MKKAVISEKSKKKVCKRYPGKKHIFVKSDYAEEGRLSVGVGKSIRDQADIITDETGLGISYLARLAFDGLLAYYKKHGSLPVFQEQCFKPGRPGGRRTATQKRGRG